MTTIKSASKLLSYMEREKIKNVLIGNGFSLAHPKLKDCFEWDMHQALCASWKDMIPNESEGCPEKDLNTIRINITKMILCYYIDKLRNETSSESEYLSQLFQSYKDKIPYNCSQFLRADSLKGGYILTLNYDPLLYYEILKLLDANILMDLSLVAMMEEMVVSLDIPILTILF